MASYKKNEARAWALENMCGVANVVIPTFTQDLKRLNETAIRYDIEKEIERLKTLGAELMEGPIDVPNGPLIAFIKAPDNVRIELLQLSR